MRKIFFCLVCLLPVIKGFSQTTLGIRAGSNASTVFTRDNASGTQFETDIKEPVLGYYLGVFSTFDFAEKFGLRPELILSRKGFKVEMPRLEGNNTIARFYYLNLPLLLSYKTSEKVSLLAGPEFGYLLKSSGKKKDREEYKPFDSKERSDIGLALGMSYLLDPAFEIEVRYTHGFTQLSPFLSLNGMQNRSLQLGVAYTLFSNN
ncbi:MAG: porin family protein [Adhaeribacter sp.]